MANFKHCTHCNKTLPASNFLLRVLAPKKDGTKGKSLRSSCIDCSSIRRVCNKFGISKEHYTHLLSSQGYKCKICSNAETAVDARYGKIKSLALDHCHTTGKLRGFLCDNCNRALGLLKENSTYFEKAIEYLKVHGL